MFDEALKGAVVVKRIQSKDNENQSIEQKTAQEF